VLRFLTFTKLFEVHINVSDFAIGGVLIQDGQPIPFNNKKFYGAQLWLPIHEKELYVVMYCMKAWQHYLGTHKTKVFTNNISLWYFETHSKALAKQLRWHDTLALLDVELIHKPWRDNVVPNALSRKEEF
jgi:hypothetical protein